MRPSPPKALEKARAQRFPYVSDAGAMHGMFEIQGPGFYKLRILSSGEARGEGQEGYQAGISEWEHVSVSVKGRRFTPTWEEMAFVKALFWSEDETVLQFHPPRSEYINNHPGTLHLWKPPYDAPTPPAITVGLKALNLT